MKRRNLYVLKVLDAMRSYLVNQNNHFYIGTSSAYCPACEAITAVVGDYERSTGTDCLGEHFKIVKAPEQCRECRTTKFIKISKDDMLNLRKEYGNRTAEILIDGIKKGLERMYSPSLYNEELPKIANKWKRLNKQEKIRQINQLLNEQKKLSIAREGVRNLEEALTV